MYVTIPEQFLLNNFTVPAIRKTVDARKTSHGEEGAEWVTLSAPGLQKIVVKKKKAPAKKTAPRVRKSRLTVKKAAPKSLPKASARPENGWGRLMQRLEKDGISSQQVRAVYLNQQMPEFRQVLFKLNPQESAHIYAGHTTAGRIERAAGFMKTYEQTFKKAERDTGVDAYLVAAIISVESDCGLNFGRQLVVNRLSRIANIAEEQNLDYVYAKLKSENSNVTREQVAQRAFILEEIFYPQVLALFQLAREQKVSILGLRGSSAGGIGYPQFLPLPWKTFGKDGNRDGIVSLFQAEDAILSCAQYLKKYGWKPGISEQQRFEVLRSYNNSRAYADAVLRVRDLLSESDQTGK